MLPVSLREHDIRLCLRMRLGGDSELDAMGKGLEGDILKPVPQAISEVCVFSKSSILEVDLTVVGRFLLVSLNIDAILAEAIIHQGRQALHRMAKISVANKAFDDRTRGVRRGVFESGLLKMGIEGGGSLTS